MSHSWIDGHPRHRSMDATKRGRSDPNGFRPPPRGQQAKQPVGALFPVRNPSPNVGLIRATVWASYPAGRTVSIP